MLIYNAIPNHDDNYQSKINITRSIENIYSRNHRNSYLDCGSKRGIGRTLEPDDFFFNQTLNSLRTEQRADNVL